MKKKFYTYLSLAIVLTSCNPLQYTQYRLVADTPLEVRGSREMFAERYRDIPAGDTIEVLSDKLFASVSEVTKARYKNYNIWVKGAVSRTHRISTAKILRKRYHSSKPIYLSLDSFPPYSETLQTNANTGTVQTILPETTEERNLVINKHAATPVPKHSTRKKKYSTRAGRLSSTKDRRLAVKRKNTRTRAAAYDDPAYSNELESHDRSSLPKNQKSYSSSTYGGRTGFTPSTGATIHTGPRGGRYYINKNGNKTYVKRSGSSSSYRPKSSSSYSSKSTYRPSYRKK